MPPQHRDREGMEMDERDERRSAEKRGLFYNIIGGILIAGCCWSLGYGYSQSTLGSTVARVSMSVDHVREIQMADRKSSEEADARLSKEIADYRSSSGESLRSILSLVQRVTEQNQELIAFLRAELQTQPSPKRGAP